MPSQIQIGPFLTRPSIKAGTNKTVYIDPLEPTAAVTISSECGGQPSCSPVSGVTVDLYLPTVDPANLPVGEGMYTGTTDSQGMVTFILPSIA
jgi:hypothetical protein